MTNDNKYVIIPLRYKILKFYNKGDVSQMKKTVSIIIALILCVTVMAIPAMATSAWLEAETEAVLSDGAEVLDIAKASGGKAVSLGEAAFKVDIDIEDRYFVRVGHRAGEGRIVAVIDGAEYDLGIGNATYGTKWVVVPFSVGEHEIVIKSENGGIVVDYLSVYNSSNIPMGSDSPSSGYDNPLANPETSDVSYAVVILATISALTVAGVSLSLKHREH